MLYTQLPNLQQSIYYTDFIYLYNNTTHTIQYNTIQYNTIQNNTILKITIYIYIYIYVIYSIAESMEYLVKC